MIDRNGQIVFVGWHDWEMIWLEAALTLPRSERLSAFQDIGELSGRGLCAVQAKASAIMSARRTRRVVVPYRYIPNVPRAATSMAPSELKQPTKQQMMARR